MSGWDMFDGASAMLDAHDAKPQPGTCATCRHWEAPKGKFDEHGDCLLIDADSEGLAAYVPDDWCGLLCTLPTFGCTLWQARDGVLGNMMTDGRNSWPKESK